MDVTRYHQTIRSWGIPGTSKVRQGGTTYGVVIVLVAGHWELHVYVHCLAFRFHVGWTLDQMDIGKTADSHRHGCQPPLSQFTLSSPTPPRLGNHDGQWQPRLLCACGVGWIYRPCWPSGRPPPFKDTLIYSPAWFYSPVDSPFPSGPI